MQAISEYESFQDPGFSIPKEASLVNNITDDMVKDHQINWNRVIEILNLSQLCVAHNAAFDRAFLDKNLAESKNKVWACSINDIDWIERGFTNSKLELFFSDFKIEENILSGILKKKKNEFLEWVIPQVTIESFHARVPSLEQIFIEKVGK